jgi:glycine betaine/proline transport system ATP-binding protein
MKDLGISSLFVTDKEGVLLGIVTIEQVSELFKEGKEHLGDVVNKEVETVNGDVSIDEIIPMVLNSKYPVAVTDSERKLQGIIVKSTVLAGIAGEGGQKMTLSMKFLLGALWKK